MKSLQAQILGTAEACIYATLARQTVVNSGAEHLGFGGYFLFEANESPEAKGISVLGKASSLEAAFRLIDLWDLRPQLAV